MGHMTVLEAVEDILHNGGRQVAQLPPEEQKVLREACRSVSLRRLRIVRLASFFLWWTFTLAVASSPWWAHHFGKPAEDAFLRGHAFLFAQLGIALALLLFNLLGAPWRVLPDIRLSQKPPVTAR